ncbi:MAG TPA: ABC transporter ATP-binding protein [Candidatus Polarisedimenticolia bacterium]|nr:ABC transporter ATP-binding protein [Candidatus Polarisedimenticolia bacterium]
MDGLSLEVCPGEVFGVLGHNGAGKTTTVRLLNGILAPTAGKAEVLGLDPVRDGPTLRGRTGVLTEVPSVDDRLTATENLTFHGRFYALPSAELSRRVKALLEEFGLAERAKDRVGTYSKGMRQRLALARAILHDPELLFLDEPTSGLDPVAARQVHELIGLLRRRERTIFMCTHNLVEAQRLCDRVAVMRAGRILAMGSPGELGQRYGAVRVELEVEAPRVSETVAALRGAGHAAAEPMESGVVAVRGAGHADVPSILETLVAARIPVYRAGVEHAALEDVYYALMGDVRAE